MNARLLAVVLTALLLTAAPLAGAAEPPKLDAANTAWMITASVLVLFMTLPGLALFYAGLVRAKNVLSVLMQCFAITCVVTLAWVVVGYSIAFGDGGSANAWFGGFGKSFLSGIDVKAVRGSIPETVFAMFQLTFAIITPALVIGAYAERVRFGGMLLFSLLWLLRRLLPDRALGVGRRLAAEDGRDGFRRRPGGAPERGHGGVGVRARARQAQGLPRHGDAAAQPDDDGDRRVHALGGLVRLQRRQRPRRRRQRRHGDAGDAHRCGHRLRSPGYFASGSATASLRFSASSPAW